jgi:hypothetical protein
LRERQTLHRRDGAALSGYGVNQALVNLLNEAVAKSFAPAKQRDQNE